MLLTCFNELSAFYRIHSSWCMIYLRLIEMPAAFQRWEAIYRHRNTVRMIRKLCVFSTTKYSGGNHGTEWMKHHNTQLTCWWRVSINLNSMSPRHTFTNYYMVQMTHVMLISTIYHVYQYMKVDKVSCVLWHNLPYGIHQRALSRITQNKAHIWTECVSIYRYYHIFVVQQMIAAQRKHLLTWDNQYK